ncbi:hypothetical protein RA27_02105 [Ruegeria sp. ANG-R]|uniref:SNF2-related protein n=1 Tax=Ruegeria sp. ANG-R TaxID=1577903 RepID=UPI00057CD0A5|nr:DEAD/DEAH box helicase [Ruegeria sp. ANG-R]KIC42211.1 hypothetical protein RA27_02105 [Ruegeria sp. ANG-R]
MNAYGTLDYNGTAWRISDLQPHVAIAFKRLFPKVPAHGTELFLSDTDENRADLHWFMQRYPMNHNHGPILVEGVERLTTKAAERERILMPGWTPGETAGFCDGKQPYNYQKQAAAVTIQNPSLLLGDDLGLGKTISALCTLTSGAPLPAAVVVQAHLADQWAERAHEFTHLRVHVIKGTKPYDLPVADLYVFRYSNIAGWIDIINTGLFKTAIYDEAQELRTGHETAKGNAARILSSQATVRLGLTATPIYNYGDEIFNVMQFIEPNMLGNRDEFMREWCGWSKTVRDPDALGTYLRDKGYFLRRTEHDASVAAEIPPLNTVDWEVEWNDGAADEAEDLFKTLALTVLEGSFVKAGKAARELDMKMRLLTGVAKADAVAAYVDMLLQDSPRVLLAGWHRDVYEKWMSALAHHNPVLYTGSETAAAKRRNVKAFTTGNSRVIAISLRSGAGLDGLQEYCNEVVFGELDWSPQVHKQVIGRLRRPGQTKQVTAHYLHTSGGSDPVIMDMLGVKADQSRGIVDPMKGYEAKHQDDTRIRRLAKAVLGREDDE